MNKQFIKLVENTNGEVLMENPMMVATTIGGSIGGFLGGLGGSFLKQGSSGIVELGKQALGAIPTAVEAVIDSGKKLGKLKNTDKQVYNKLLTILKDSSRDIKSVTPIMKEAIRTIEDKQSIIPYVLTDYNKFAKKLSKYEKDAEVSQEKMVGVLRTIKKFELILKMLGDKNAT